MALTHTIYPEILTGARKGGEQGRQITDKPNLKNHIRRVANWTLTYGLSHGGYCIKYRVAWWVIMTSLVMD